MYVFHVCMQVPMEAKGSPELEFQMVGSHLRRVLGTGPVSFIRAVSSFC